MVRVYILVFILLILTKQSVQAQQSASYGLWTLDISHDDKYIATGGDDSLLKIYTNDFRLQVEIKLEKFGMIRHLAWHPKENLLGVTTRHSTFFLNPETRKDMPLEGNPGGARASGWNYTGELFAAASGSGQLWIWNRQGKLLHKTQKKDRKDFLALDWHPSKNILVTVGDEIRIYDTSGHQLNMFPHRKQLAGILTVKWHPSGDFFVTGDYGHPAEGVKTLLQFWKPDGTLIKEWSGSKHEFRYIRWNKQGTLLATGSDALRIWSDQGELLYTGETDGHTLWGVDWVSDSAKIITASFGKGDVKVWDSKAKLLTVVHGNEYPRTRQ
jgi:WD40 repeat protein